MCVCIYIYRSRFIMRTVTVNAKIYLIVFKYHFHFFLRHGREINFHENNHKKKTSLHMVKPLQSFSLKPAETYTNLDRINSQY